jgi:prepilin-type N-terminal cleavage/methylation domain-containing protein
MKAHTFMRFHRRKLARRLRGARRAGFTMIEVTLALLVVAVGVLGAFSLIPAGLQTNRNAIEDTQMAMFAEMFFDSIRMQAEAPNIPWTSVATTAIFAPGWRSGVTPHMPTSRYFWGTAATTSMLVGGSVNSPRTYYQRTGADATEPSELALRYATQQVVTATPNKSRGVRLLVWPEFGTTSLSNAREFYTEILNTQP